MVGMGERSKHVAAAMYRFEPQFKLVWPIPSAQWVAAKWKTIEPKKVKDLDFSREDFDQIEKKRLLLASTKKRFHPLKNYDLKPLRIKDFAEAMNKVSPQSTLHTVEPKTKVHFVK